MMMLIIANIMVMLAAIAAVISSLAARKVVSICKAWEASLAERSSRS